MRRVSLAILTTLFFCSLFSVVNAQNAQHPWSISTGAVFLKYHAPASLTPLEGAVFQPAVQLSLGKYLGGAFDFRTQFTAAKQVSFPAPLSELPSNTVKSMLMDMSYLLSFKINNGVFLKQNSFFGPYVLFGIGGSYVEQNPDVYLPLGGGIKFRVNDRIDVRVESSKKFSVNKDFQNTAHSLSVAYNVGKNKKKVFQEDISREKVIEDTKPKDTDEDGVFDEDDLCPETPGLAKLFGCPEEEEDSVQMDSISVEPTEEEFVPEPDTAIEIEEEKEGVVQPSKVETHEVKAPEINETATHIENVEAESVEEEKLTEIPPAAAPAKPVPSKHAETVYEEKIPCNIELPINDFSIYFDHASTDLPAQAKSKLDEVADLMQACGSSKLVLQGHTDDIGADRNNKALSVLRAHKVKYYLVYQHGIRQSRIESEGYGETKPKADNDTDQGRERNRRVDFTLIQ